MFLFLVSLMACEDNKSRGIPLRIPKRTLFEFIVMSSG